MADPWESAGLDTIQKRLAAGADPKTVEVHRAHVMEKMEVGSLADLIRTVLAIESR